jgi:thioredoxin 1
MAEHTVQLTDATFGTEVEQASGLIVVDFNAAWCGPCKAIAPILETLAEKYAGAVKIGKIDVDENQAVARKYGVRSLPTLLFFRDGKVIDTYVGAMSRGAIEKAIQAHS